MTYVEHQLKVLDHYLVTVKSDLKNGLISAEDYEKINVLVKEEITYFLNYYRL